MAAEMPAALVSFVEIDSCCAEADEDSLSIPLKRCITAVSSPPQFSLAVDSSDAEAKEKSEVNGTELATPIRHVSLDLVSDDEGMGNDPNAHRAITELLSDDEEERPLVELMPAPWSLRRGTGTRGIQAAPDAPCATVAENGAVQQGDAGIVQKHRDIRWDPVDRRFQFKLTRSNGVVVHFQTTTKAAGINQLAAEQICHLCYGALERGASKDAVTAYRNQLYRQARAGEALAPLDVPEQMQGSLLLASHCDHVSTGVVRNKDFCEVCQKTGRLLLCDTCPRAFHARCVQRFVDHKELVQGARWTCPVCTQGADVLHGLTSTVSISGDLELHQRMADTSRHDRKQRRAAERRRDTFLAQHSRLFEAMATKGTLSRIQRNREAFSVLEIGALVDVTGGDGSTYTGTVLLQASSSSYIVADVATKAEAMIERDNLSELLDTGERDEHDFLTYARKPVLDEGVTLKGYQSVGTNWLIHTCLNRCGGILADDMGLGKTIQTLACLSYLRSSGTLSGPFLIVVPLSCVGNWFREAKRFVPHLTVAKICGSAREKEHALQDDETWFGLKDIVITTYESAVSTEEFLQRHFWAVLVLDEAHRIKNQSSRIREVLDTVKCASRLLLTGTPLQNNLGELFTLLKFLWPDVLLHAPESLESTVRPPGADPATDELLLKQLRALLQMLMLRRLKEDVITLPPKVLRDVWLPLTPCQVSWYKALLQSRARDERTNVGTVMKLLGRLRMVFCHPCCLADTDQDYADLEKEGLAGMLDPNIAWGSPVISQDFLHQSGKLMFLDKLLMHLHAQNMCISPKWRRDFQERQHQDDRSDRGINSSLSGADAAHFLSEAHPWRPPIAVDHGVDGTSSDTQHHQHSVLQSGPEDHDCKDRARPHKVLIFSQFLSCLHLLEAYCKWRGWRALRLDGATHRVLRELDIRDFNSDDEDIFIYLISTRAGGIGINLASANHVVMFDHDWNPQIDHQAIDRAHRINQQRVVTVYRLVQEWSVEERLVARQEEKLRMERSVADFTGSSNGSGEVRLSAAEIMELLHYGEEALQQFAGESIFDQPLRWFLDRERRPLLKPEKSEMAASATTLAQTNAEREWSAQATKRTAHSQVSEEASPLKKARFIEPAASESPLQEKQTSSGRIVRQPSQFNASSAASPKAASRRPVLKHCNTCFICGAGKRRPSVESQMVCEAGTKRKGAGAAPDVVCNLCPKAYHSACLSPGALQQLGRGTRWACGWHACAECSRTASMCGGMLISCMKCPTALCHECFPPNFRRVHPPSSFWSELNDLGWSVSPDKMVLFICNSCREVEERLKQQKMCAEDLAARNDERQRAALEEQRHLAEQKRPIEEAHLRHPRPLDAASPMKCISPRVRIRGKQSPKTHDTEGYPDSCGAETMDVGTGTPGRSWSPRSPRSAWGIVK